MPDHMDPMFIFGTPEWKSRQEAAYTSSVRMHTAARDYPGGTFGTLESMAAQWEATGTPIGQPLSFEAARDISGFQAGLDAGGMIGTFFAGDKSSILEAAGIELPAGSSKIDSPKADSLTSNEKTNVAKLVLEAFPWMKQLPGIWDIILEGVTTDLPDEIILANIRGTEAYQQRFPAMAVRELGNLNPINEAEYLSLEDSYRTLLSSYGVMGTLAQSEDILQGFFTDWIGGDVSPVELSIRLDKGYAAMTDAAPGVREAFRDFYGVEIDDSTLLTYFLDRDLGLIEMENVIGAAHVGGAAIKYGLNITRTRAELLSGEGVTESMAREGFADVAREAPQLEKLARMHSFNPLSQQDLEGFVFHDDPEVAKRRRKIFDTALASFAGSGATSVTRRGTLGELVDIDRSV